MAIILCIDTATEVCSVAISNNGNVIALAQNNDGNTHASQLHVLVDEAIAMVNFSIKNIDAIAVSKGPGSYTGLRVGVSAAKGFCFALDIPLIGINTLDSLVRMPNLDAMNAGISNTNNVINDSQKDKLFFIPMLDARRMEVYCAVYDNNYNAIENTQAVIINEKSFIQFLDLGKVYFYGNGAAKCQSIITHSNAIFINDIKCCAASMKFLAEQKYQAKHFEDVAYFEPFYLKDFVGTTPKKLI